MIYLFEGSKLRRSIARPFNEFLDHVAIHVATWGLRRLYGANCATDVRDDFPGENAICMSCDAKRLIDDMHEIYDY